MEKTLKQLFDYQLFENNPRLAAMLSRTHEKYDFSGDGELTDDDDVRELGVNIAGYEDAPGGMHGDDDVDDFNFGDDDGEDDDDSYEEDEHDEFDGFTFEDADGNYEE